MWCKHYVTETDKGKLTNKASSTVDVKLNLKQQTVILKWSMRKVI